MSREYLPYRYISNSNKSPELHVLSYNSEQGSCTTFLSNNLPVVFIIKPELLTGILSWYSGFYKLVCGSCDRHSMIIISTWWTIWVSIARECDWPQGLPSFLYSE